MHLYTIGHSNHPIDKLIRLLQAQSISQVVDVRSTPYSRFNPQFNQANLQRSSAEHAIQYIYLGDSLGGRPKDPTCYIHGTVPTSSKDYPHEIDYTAVMQRPWFIQGIERLLEMASHEITAILCSEEDPAHCHRHYLIARYLMLTHPEVNILHIRKDGSILEAQAVESPHGDQDSNQLTFLKP